MVAEYVTDIQVDGKDVKIGFTLHRNDISWRILSRDFDSTSLTTYDCKTIEFIVHSLIMDMHAPRTLH